ncbi:MAG: serine/threonine protein kinase [Planctomycetales bacterium]|nr:serine/threonine protein kinase [Planctomycetales bacterium]
MGLFDKLSTMLQGNKVNIDKRFEKLRQAVAGTMSKFYMARDRTTDKIVGLKVGEREKVEAFEARFKGLSKPPEGKIAMELKHPRIVETYEYGMTTDNLPYMVMEFLEGPGMHTVVKERDEDVMAGHRVRYIRHMAEALAVVHQRGFIHRDVCPRNFIYLPATREVRLIDFGLTVPATPEFMQPGNRTGTPLYMAPEVVRRRPTDQRLDIFSFGVTAYSICCFDLPWPVTETTGLAALAHDTVPPKPLQEVRPDLDPTLCRAIMQCVESSLDKRTQSMDLFLNAIKNLED